MSLSLSHQSAGSRKTCKGAPLLLSINASITLSHTHKNMSHFVLAGCSVSNNVLIFFSSLCQFFFAAAAAAVSTTKRAHISCFDPQFSRRCAICKTGLQIPTIWAPLTNFQNKADIIILLLIDILHTTMEHFSCADDSFLHFLFRQHFDVVKKLLAS